MPMARQSMLLWMARPARQTCRTMSTTPAGVDVRRRAMLDRIIRVDHAGELAADRIYAGQMAVLGKTATGPVIKEMWEQEKKHLAKFESLLPQYRARPSALIPFWNIAGFALGAGTALLGKQAAMACTVAVEEIIGDHYNSQIRELLEDNPELHKELLETIREFRDDELGHLETGMQNEAEQAPFYKTLTEVIKIGCRGAVWVAERV
ncbi:PREDICTED: 5-demethoxyubiquinone hydroxylase, mitochondrial-like [Priapulus caudatus]|uniref:5-demethoxyubiquinone hydroxylase, mitochondrial n=1 Tax=Priapulus caudatus TaxID=37621 RepID=A0ABM1EL17_PRICU|nr:PREDICTED: 5-demethoxyubiquinone hydroxylase, mitochondrial-like [Priapulus caudatus]XP_014672888.1 PREDICTED: 5-demethoxyubiquinone hydroxylase, mitochondrial-like [Priapulus caudatus]